jgi:hypothetical protein
MVELILLNFRQLRLPMNERRQKAALNLFNSMDVNKDGKLTILDLKVLIHSFLFLLNKYLKIFLFR